MTINPGPEEKKGQYLCDACGGSFPKEEMAFSNKCLGCQKKKGITAQQRKAMHKWFEMVAQECLYEGLPGIEIVEYIVEQGIPFTITKEWVKDYVFRPIAKVKYGVESTEDLEPKQVNEVYLDTVQLFSRVRPEMKLPLFPTEFDKYYETDTKKT